MACTPSFITTPSFHNWGVLDWTNVPFKREPTRAWSVVPVCLVNNLIRFPFLPEVQSMCERLRLDVHLTVFRQGCRIAKLAA